MMMIFESGDATALPTYLPTYLPYLNSFPLALALALFPALLPHSTNGAHGGEEWLRLSQRQRLQHHTPGTTLPHHLRQKDQNSPQHTFTSSTIHHPPSTFHLPQLQHSLDADSNARWDPAAAVAPAAACASCLRLPTSS
ncbi:hypothetical protein AC578_2101 [Pseudocercospora eumusae]|uniref:Uncharacterized protein n=1 Tax=Pseudocercospora eumusae TaxID=321146 RepID=A0A139HQB1_9PEZI|nr:hypothetical protein AC578_2101 [Pseudocercospora eumusae]